MEHYGYKRCGNYIVKLLIPNFAITNENRNGVKNKFRAKHRTNIAGVIDIKDLTNQAGPRYVVSTFHKKWLKYELGKVVECLDFDYNLNKICSTGIHYFLNEEQARNYSGGKYSCIGNNINGIMSYYDGNGENVYSIAFRNGRPQNYI